MIFVKNVNPLSKCVHTLHIFIFTSIEIFNFRYIYSITYIENVCKCSF